MKTVSFLFCLLVLLTFSACKYKRNLPVGSWKLVYAKQMSGDSVIHELPGDISGAQIKIWSEKNFLFAGSKKIAPDSVFEDTYGAGSYKLIDNKYQEIVQYHFNKLAEHQIFNMILEIKHDTLTQMWPVDQYGKVIPANYYIEKYVRIK